MTSRHVQTREVVEPKNRHYPSMSAQDYWFIADILATLPDRPSKKTVAKAFADQLVHTNPNFKSALFLEAATRSNK